MPSSESEIKTVKDLIGWLKTFKPNAKLLQRDHYGDPIYLDKYNFYREPNTGNLRIEPEDIGPEPD